MLTDVHRCSFGVKAFLTAISGKLKPWSILILMRAQLGGIIQHFHTNVDVLGLLSLLFNINAVYAIQFVDSRGPHFISQTKRGGILGKSLTVVHARFPGVSIQNIGCF